MYKEDFYILRDLKKEIEQLQKMLEDSRVRLQVGTIARIPLQCFAIPCSQSSLTTDRFFCSRKTLKNGYEPCLLQPKGHLSGMCNPLVQLPYSFTVLLCGFCVMHP